MRRVWKKLNRHSFSTCSYIYNYYYINILLYYNLNKISVNNNNIQPRVFFSFRYETGLFRYPAAMSYSLCLDILLGGPPNKWQIWRKHSKKILNYKRKCSGVTNSQRIQTWFLWNTETNIYHQTTAVPRLIINQLYRLKTPIAEQKYI